MEVELKAEAADKRLNTAVAMTVVVISIFTAFSKIKDDNLMLAMQASKADALDKWNEYQAEKVKLHLAEQTQIIAGLSPAQPTGGNPDAIEATLDAKIAKYDASANQLVQDAKDLQARYDGLNSRHDQLDLADAGFAISLSLAAVAALTELGWLLGISWAFGAAGALMALAAFKGWAFHPDWLVSWLG